MLARCSAPGLTLLSLDGLPEESGRPEGIQKMLLQVMTEEKATGFKTEPLGNRRQRIASIGQNPWLVRKIEGTIEAPGGSR
jgi:hypothetical protein